MAARKQAQTNGAGKSEARAKGNGDDVLIPDKLYFRIGEVADLCRLPAYVLRFWQSEFPQLKPVKSSTGQRMYRKRDVESVLRIKQLLYEQGYTIQGARQHLRAVVGQVGIAHRVEGGRGVLGVCGRTRGLAFHFLTLLAGGEDRGENLL